MEIRPTPDQEALIRHAIASGRIGRPEDAGLEAMVPSGSGSTKLADTLPLPLRERVGVRGGNRAGLARSGIPLLPASSRKGRRGYFAQQLNVSASVGFAQMMPDGCAIAPSECWLDEIWFPSSPAIQKS